MGNTVLIPTDGSEYSESAAETGFDIAAKIDATVHALSVGNTTLVAQSSVGGEPPKTEADVTDAAAEWAHELAGMAEDAGLTAETVVRTGTPAEEIVDYATEIDPEMIVIGTAGRGGFERMIVGSVTDKVVRTAPVPVVTVRPDGSIDAA